MSSQRQEELSALLDRVFELVAIRQLAPDARLKRVHYDWLAAGEHAQRTVAQLSQQLRRFLDDQALLENRHFMEILRGIEAHALAVRDTVPAGDFIEIDESSPDVELPFERPLYSPAMRPVIAACKLTAGDVDADALFNQIVIDKPRLASRIRHLLQSRAQVTLAEVVQAHPLEHGLAELVAYLTLAAEDDKAVFDESRRTPGSGGSPNCRALFL
jgi:hypothetical protein